MEKAFKAFDAIALSLKGKSKSHQSATTSVEGKGTGYGGAASEKKKKTGSNNRDKAISTQSKDDIQLQSSLSLLAEVIEREAFETSATILGKLTDCVGLQWALKYLLVNDSLLDIGSRPEVYNCLLNFIKVVSNEPFAAPFLTQVPDGEDLSLSVLLANLAKQSKTFLSLYQNQEADDEDDEVSSALMLALDITDCHRSLSEGCANSSVLGISPNHKSTGKVLNKRNRTESSSSSSSSSCKHQRSGDESSAEQKYLTALRPLKFDTLSLCDLITSRTTQHCFVGQNSQQYMNQSAGHAGVVGDARKRLVRVACEMSGLSASLPVEFGSSVFVRCDEARMDILKALVIGPEDTPYANGCFEFDIMLPPAYPSVPPNVQLVTTGGGTVRFNPNLYNCGKVCLSLLGTWAGPGWDPVESTLLQVLVSIQSLILVPDPYFNEPGFEGQQNSPAGKKASEQYNDNIRTQTLRFAILGALQTPSPVFREVVTQHFFHKRAVIAQQLQEWTAQSATASRPAMQKLADEAESALVALVSQVESASAAACYSSSSSSSGAVSQVVDLIGDEEDEELRKALEQSAQEATLLSPAAKSSRRASTKEDCIVID